MSIKLPMTSSARMLGSPTSRRRLPKNLKISSYLMNLITFCHLMTQIVQSEKKPISQA